MMGEAFHQLIKSYKHGCPFLGRMVNTPYRGGEGSNEERGRGRKRQVQLLSFIFAGVNSYLET